MKNIKILWHVDPLLLIDRNISKYILLLLFGL
jgi:hypothetical protein